MLGVPGPEHLIFIPGVLLLGIALGWALGAKAAREKLEKRRARARARARASARRSSALPRGLRGRTRRATLRRNPSSSRFP